jgi:putative NADH-flavin reductase
VKVLVIGATGGVGQWVVKLGLKRGHLITAFVRDSGRMNMQHEHLRVVTGDVLDPGSFIPAVQSQDAVISALGSRTLKPSTVCSQGTQNLVRAMEQEKVARLVAISSLGVGESRKKAGFLLAHILVPLLLSNAIRDLEKAEAIIWASHLEWVIVRPDGLTNHAPVGHYRVAEGGLRSGSISRGDVASFMLQQVDDNTYLRKPVAIAG